MFSAFTYIGARKVPKLMPQSRSISVPNTYKKPERRSDISTGVMHLAATTKKIKQAVNEELSTLNAVKIITLFGGTNPAFHGHCTRPVILGRG